MGEAARQEGIVHGKRVDPALVPKRLRGR